MYVRVRVTVSTGPKKTGGITCPLTRNRPLKHHPSGVFAPHDRWNFLDAGQKAYAIPPVVVLVCGERFPSLQIQGLSHDIPLHRVQQVMLDLYAFPIYFLSAELLYAVHTKYDVTRLDAPFFSAFLATHRLAFLIIFRRGGSLR